MGYFVFGLSPFRYVAEDQHAANSHSVFITDGSGAVVNEGLPAVPGNQLCVVGKRDGLPFRQCPYERVFNRMPGGLIDDAKYFRNVTPGGFFLTPTRQLPGLTAEASSPASVLVPPLCSFNTKESYPPPSRSRCLRGRRAISMAVGGSTLTM